MSDLTSFVTGLSNSLNSYLGTQYKAQTEVAKFKQEKQFEQSLKGQINADMAERILPGQGGQLAQDFYNQNSRYPTVDEAKTFLDSTMMGAAGQRKPYFTVLGYDDKAGGYLSHNAADNSFTVTPMTRIIGKTKPNLPAAEAEWFAKAETLAEVFDDVNRLYKDSYVGPIAGRSGRAVDVYTPFGDADRSRFRNQVAKGFNSLIYLRSGKQINQEEAIRMAEEFMSQHNTPIAFKSAWDTMAMELNNLSNERQKNLELQGFAKAETLAGKGRVTAKPLSKKSDPLDLGI